MRITTTYQGPTDAPAGAVRGARIVARGGGKQLTAKYDYGVRDMHAVAAQDLADRERWGAIRPVETGGKEQVWETYDG